ncbi:MAG: hypothetical protein ITD36_03640 [Nitrospira sp.]|jgi:hypothetical protein|nr:hypothetical protein [Nitrospira sp.]MBP0121172.1 hypothetical protein [Nitrospira sp.]MBP0123508.1 hypothetical protein [Nitrospira sp.]MBP0127111.1 hypothetical protein [Nitrospira sp.]MBP0130704.1 hypothetical protein [Nitrospira sp.]
MATTINHATMPNEDCVVRRLRECGASSIEDLLRLAGLDWVTVFSIIDRLNRAGSVVLEKTGLIIWCHWRKEYEQSRGPQN